MGMRHLTVGLESRGCSLAVVMPTGTTSISELFMDEQIVCVYIQNRAWKSLKSYCRAQPCLLSACGSTNFKAVDSI